MNGDAHAHPVSPKALNFDFHQEFLGAFPLTVLVVFSYDAAGSAGRRRLVLLEAIPVGPLRMLVTYVDET